jgi:DNA-binding CsgD family transcriptional regulator
MLTRRHEGAKMGHYTQEELGRVIGQIYDCAIDPAIWVPTLTGIRDRMEAAYFQVTYVDVARSHTAPNTAAVMFQTEWPSKWNELGPRYMHLIPGIERWMALGIDESMTQLQCIDEAEFHKMPFYVEYAEPQGLRDFCHTTVAKRPDVFATSGAARRAGKQVFDSEDRKQFCLLSPHIRRSLLISGMLDEGRFQLALYRQLLDKLANPIFILEQSARLVYANAQADDLLSKGRFFRLMRGSLTPDARHLAGGFEEALARACSGRDEDMGLRGNGIPLPGKDGSPAVCYVLPLGNSERRRALGPGMAAVFVSTSPNGIPPAVEVLSALSGLTSREARIALMIADGRAPIDAATELGISINTVRTHIAKIFEKTGVKSQQGLVKFISTLSLPLAINTAV